MVFVPETGPLSPITTSTIRTMVASFLVDLTMGLPVSITLSNIRPRRTPFFCQSRPTMLKR